jgi:hypothetical protein
MKQHAIGSQQYTRKQTAGTQQRILTRPPSLPFGFSSPPDLLHFPQAVSKPFGKRPQEKLRYPTPFYKNKDFASCAPQTVRKPPARTHALDRDMHA